MADLPSKTRVRKVTVVEHGLGRRFGRVASSDRPGPAHWKAGLLEQPRNGAEYLEIHGLLVLTQAHTRRRLANSARLNTDCGGVDVLTTTNRLPHAS